MRGNITHSYSVNRVLPWIVSPKLALAVLEAEIGTACHVSNLDAICQLFLSVLPIFSDFLSTACYVSNLDAFRGVQVVP